MEVYKNQIVETTVLDKVVCDMCSKDLPAGNNYKYHFFKLEYDGIHLEDVIRDVCYDCSIDKKALKQYKKVLDIEIDEKYKHLKEK